MDVGTKSDFFSHVETLIEQFSPEALHIEALIEDFKAKRRTLASIVNRATRYTTTRSLKKADRNRDNGAGLLGNIVRAYLTSLVPAKREAAEWLAPQIAPFKGIRRHERAQQSAETQSLLNVLDREDNQEAIRILGIKEDVEALREAHEAFGMLFYERAAETGNRMKQRAIQTPQAIADTEAVYREITRIVNAYAIAQPSEAVEGFIRQMNGLVAVFERVADNTGKSWKVKKAGKEEEAPEKTGE